MRDIVATRLAAGGDHALIPWFTDPRRIDA